MTRFAKESRLIFDLGMNNGDDTAYYLARGYNVVALEANPLLCERARIHFAGPIRERRLTIVNAAISDKPGNAPFYVNLDNDHWSSLDTSWASRDGSKYKETVVACVTLGSLFAEFGVPFYLKIDVEGADQSVLDQLHGLDLRPLFVSVEDCRFGFRYMEALLACGYDRFKLLDQSTVPSMTDSITGHRFPAGSSGPIGNDLPGEWCSYGEIVKVYEFTVRDRHGNRQAPRTQWWDIHCTHAGPHRPA